MASPRKSFRSIAELFAHRVTASGDKLAYEYPDGQGFVPMTWRQTGDRVRSIACGLLSFGLRSEQRIAILCSTRIEWILFDFGILCAGGATTTVYPSNTAEECAFILSDSESRFVLAEDREQVEKLKSVRSSLAGIDTIVTLDDQVCDGDWVISLQELEKLGLQYDKDHPRLYDETVASVEPTQLATLIYTSGTTGQPKGVELTHDCWVFEAEAIETLEIYRPEDHSYLWLPLAHSFGKVLEVAQLQVGISSAIDGRIPKLIENLAIVRPTLMAAAPRIFEKLYNRIVTNAAESGPLQRGVFRWAAGVGLKVSRIWQAGGKLNPWLALQHRLADRLVFAKIRALFGGRVRLFISGSAPLSQQIAEFFHGAGILILEGYGLTESSAATCVNHPKDFRFGSVGRPVPGVEVKIAEDDGEILLGGRGVMRGYHNLPDETHASLDGGWLKTGDIGQVDDDGFLRITDRKKDLIKTSGGKYIAPQRLEGRLKTLCPYIAHVLVHGDRRNFCSALITLDTESISKWARDRGGTQMDPLSLVESDAVQKMVDDAVNDLNSELASYETIKRFKILPKEFTLEDGELTPSMKLKRKVVEERHREVLDGFYDGAISRI